MCKLQRDGDILTRYEILSQVCKYRVVLSNTSASHFNHSFACLLTHSITHPLYPSLAYSPLALPTLPHLLTCSLAYFITHHFTPSLAYSLTRSLHHSPSFSLIHSLTHLQPPNIAFSPARKLDCSHFFFCLCKRALKY